MVKLEGNGEKAVTNCRIAQIMVKLGGISAIK
jgi:hypothetical protein